MYSGVVWKVEEIDWERQTRQSDTIIGEGTPAEQGRAGQSLEYLHDMPMDMSCRELEFGGEI